MKKNWNKLKYVLKPDKIFSLSLRLMNLNISCLVKIIIYSLFALSCMTIPIDNKCPVFVVLPPHSKNEDLAKYVLSQWQNKMKSKLPKCHKFVPVKKSEEILSLMNLNSSNIPTGTRLNEEQKENIKLAAQSTHLVELSFEINKKENIITVKNSVYSLEKNKYIKTKIFPKTFRLRGKKSLYKWSGPSPILQKAVNMLPNTFGLGWAFLNIYNKKRNEWDREKIKHNSALPSFISSISITKVPHPFLHGMTDFDYDLYLSAQIINADTEYTYQNIDENEQVTEEMIYTLNVIGGGPMINGEVSLFFWGLRGFFEAGWGPGYFKYSDNWGNSGQRYAGMPKLGFGLEYFAQKRWLLRLSTSGMGFKPAFINNERFLGSYNFSFFLGIGYYFGTIDL